MNWVISTVGGQSVTGCRLRGTEMISVSSAGITAQFTASPPLKDRWLIRRR